jgi:hypothetical protein
MGGLCEVMRSLLGFAKFCQKYGKYGVMPSFCQKYGNM